MFLAVNPLYDIREDDGTVGHLINCSNNISPEVTDFISTADPASVHACFETQIIPKLYPEKRQHIIHALLGLLFKDDDIDDAVRIGTITSNTKGDYRLEVRYNLAEVLTDFFFFTVQSVANKSGQAHIREITRDYILSFDPVRDNIILYERGVSTGLTMSVRGKGFNDNIPRRSRFFAISEQIVISLKVVALSRTEQHTFQRIDIVNMQHFCKLFLETSKQTVQINTRRPIFEHFHNGVIDFFNKVFLLGFMDYSADYSLHSVVEYGAAKKDPSVIPFIPLHGNVKDITSHLYFGKSELANVDSDNRELFDTILCRFPFLLWMICFCMSQDWRIDSFVKRLLMTYSLHNREWIQRHFLDNFLIGLNIDITV